LTDSTHPTQRVGANPPELSPASRRTTARASPSARRARRRQGS
jgi:hypothetical protein